MKTITFFFAAQFAAGLTFIQAQDTWVQKADFAGSARYDAVGFSISDKGYIGTGLSYLNYYPYYQFSKDFWEYDPSTDSWTQKADFGGTGRSGAVGFSVGSKGYIGTGLSYLNYYPYYQFNNDFWEYDPSANSWTQNASFGGTVRYLAVGFSIGNKGYIGTGGNHYNDFWEYDPSTDAWTQKANFGGTGRLGAVGFSIGSKGYIGTGDDGNFRNDFWEYDPSFNDWTQKADFGGIGRYSAVGFSIGGKGYMGTGVSQTYPYYPIDFWQYDPANNGWTQKADFEGGVRFGATGLSIGSKGFIGMGNDPGIKDFWEYTPDGGTPCNIPTSFTTASVTATTVDLQWNVVSEAIGYKVRYKIAGSSEWTNIQSKDNDKTLHGLGASTEYAWQVKSICGVQPIVSSDWSAKQTFTTGSLRLGDELSQQISLEIYPNPFTSSTIISFSLNSNSSVKLELLNVAGRKIETLLDKNISSGEHEVLLIRNQLPPGVYLLQMKVNGERMMKKLVMQ